MSRTDDFLTGAWRFDREDSSDYFAGTGQNGIGTQGGAVLNVTHPTTEHHDYTDYSDPYYHNDDDWARRTKTKPGEQIPLFETKEHPAVIHMGGATKESSTKMLDLAVQAKKDVKEKWPQAEVWADKSLSDHSGPLANHALDLAVIDGIQGLEKGEKWTPSESNGIDWSAAHDWVQQGARQANSVLSGNSYRKDAPDATYDLGELEGNKRKAVADVSKAKKASRVESFSEGVEKPTTPPYRQLNLPGIE